MPRFIVRIKGYYLDWSTIVDAPVTFGMPLNEFREYHRAEYSSQHSAFDERLARVAATGASAKNSTLEDLLVCNRAGPGEDELTLDEIYTAYCLREPIRDGWTVPLVGE